MAGAERDAGVAQAQERRAELALARRLPAGGASPACNEEPRRRPQPPFLGNAPAPPAAISRNKPVPRAQLSDVGGVKQLLGLQQHPAART